MKKISTLFDALRNEKFAIAVQDEYGVKYYGYEGQGKEWAQWANSVESKSLEDSQVPSGIIQGPYKNVSDEEIKSLIVSFGYGENSDSNFVKSKSYSHSVSIKFKTNSLVPEVMDTPIGYFLTSQYASSVTYKCLSMRHFIKEGSFLHEARANNYAFNFNKSMYNAAPNSQQNKSLRQRTDLNVGRSSERRIGIKLKSFINNTSSERTNVGIVGSMETKSIENDLEIKGIGDTIGSGSRIARRAGRAATVNFDPKAWDGDGDGIVQEGTPFQRPAIPGVNDRATGGDVDVSAAMRAWIKNTPLRSTSSSPKPPSGRRMTTAPGTPPARRVMTTAPGTPPKRRAMTTAPGTPPKRTVMTNTSAPKPPAPRKPGAQPRIEKPKVSSPRPPAQSRSVSKRVGEARAQRQVEGFASRSGKSKAKIRPGKDKAQETDGAIFESLDDAQKQTVIENLKLRYQEIQDMVKENVPGESQYDESWFTTFLRKSKKKGFVRTDADGKPLSEKSRISGELFESLRLNIGDLIPEVQDEIDKITLDLKTETRPTEIKKLTNQVKALESELRFYNETLEDLQVFDAMYENDDYSLIEQLSPESRSRAFARTVGRQKIKPPTKASKEKTYDYKDPFEGQQLPKEISFKEPSSFFETTRTYSKSKRAIIGTKKSNKLEEFRKRVLENAEAAKEKRELRKARRGRAIGIGGKRTGPSRREEARRKLRRAGRKIKRKFSGAPTEADILKEINATKDANPTVFGNGRGGKPKINLESIKKLSLLRPDKSESDVEDIDLTEGHKGKNAGSLLGKMWNAQGYNGLPEQITQEDAEFLISQGWKPIKRGHGMPKPPDNNRDGAIGYIDDYINDPDRFITGENGAFYGPGEYWSRPDGGWDGYLVGGEKSDGSDNLGTLALISPEARVQTVEESRALQKEHGRAWGKVGLALTDIGGGTVGAKDMDPQDLVKELKAALAKDFTDGDPFWSSEVGEVMSQFFSFMESATPGERQQIWNAMQYLIKAAQGDSHYTSMLYGYDGVDHLGGDPIVWFNRGAFAIVDEAMTLTEIKELAKV
jgi:hypothetical protein